MVTDLVLGVLALGGLALAGYAHYRLTFHTATRLQAAMARGILIVAGLAAGWLATRWQPPAHGLTGLLRFVVGVGLVHVPAAFILWSKRQRGVYR